MSKALRLSALALAGATTTGLIGFTAPALASDGIGLVYKRDDESGKVSGWDHAELALGGAVLAELALLGAVTVDERTSRFRSPKVRVTGPAPPDRVLADAWGVVAEKERSAQDLVARLGKGLVQTLGDRLADRGVVERQQSRLLGMLPRTRSESRAKNGTINCNMMRAQSATPQPFSSRARYQATSLGIFPAQMMMYCIACR